MAFRLPLLAWVIFYITLSLKPGGDLPDITGIDKIAHFVFFLIMAVLLRIAVAGQWQAPVMRLKKELLAFAALFALGLTVEFLQEQFIERRYFDIFDLLANVAGTLTGLRVALPRVFK